MRAVVRNLAAVILCLLMPIAPSIAQQADSAFHLRINGAEVSSGDTAQTATVYFTVEDATGRAITDVSNLKADLTLYLFYEQKFSGVISLPTIPLYVSLVLDASGNMMRDLPNVRDSTIAAVNAAPPGTFFEVIQFDDIYRIIQPFTDDKKQVAHAIQQIKSHSDAGSCLYDALFLAITAHQKAASATQERRAIVVVTDGRDERHDGTACSTRSDLNKVVQAAHDGATQVRLYAIGLTTTRAVNKRALEAISDGTGGRSVFAFASLPVQLGRAFLDMMNTLSSQRQATFETLGLAGSSGGTLTLTGLSSQGSPINLTAPVAWIVKQDSRPVFIGIARITTTGQAPSILGGIVVAGTLIVVILTLGAIWLLRTDRP